MKGSGLASAALLAALLALGPAEAGARPEGEELFREVVVASAAIPGIFPPVEIPSRAGGRPIREMHVDGGTDGGTMAPFYLAPASVLAGEGRVPARRVCLVVNARSVPGFEVTERTTLSVLGRSMDAAIRAQAAAAVAMSRAFAGRTGLELEVAAIDGRFDRQSPAPFDQGYMRALFAHGEGVGRAGTAFGVDATASTGAPHDARRAEAR